MSRAARRWPKSPGNVHIACIADPMQNALMTPSDSVAATPSPHARAGAGAAARSACPLMNVMVSRQLDAMTTGNDAYLMCLLRAGKRAGLDVRLVFAPTMAFSNRPWLKLHKSYIEIASDLAWTGSVRVKDTFWSLSPRVWGRFAFRLMTEALRRVGVRNDFTKPRSFLADVPWASEAKALAAACDQKPGVIAVAEYSSLAPVLDRLTRQSRKGVLLHDLFSLRAESFRVAGDKPDFQTITLAEEAQRVAGADLLIYASLNEAKTFGPLAPGKAAVWLRPEVPAHAVRPLAGAPRAVFLGTRHAANTDTLRHLVDDIWPKVRARIPKAELWIAGSCCADLSTQQATAPGVKPLGRVEDLGAIGGANSVGLAPTRVASGVSIKVAEYLRMGMPTVVYPTALGGFGATLDDLVDIAPDADAFADRVVTLMQDGQLRVIRGERGRAEAASRLANTEMEECLRAIVSSAAAA